MTENPEINTNLIFLGPIPPPYGGVAIFNQNLFEAIKENGRPQIWTHKTPSKRAEKVNFYKGNFLSTVRFLIKNSSNKTIIDSTIYSAEYPEAGIIIAWVILKPILGFTWIKILHDGTLPSRYHSFSLLQKLAIKLSMASFDKLLPVSQELFSWLKGAFNLGEKVQQISSLLPMPKTIIEARKSPGIQKYLPPNAKIVCSIGAFTPNYGFKQIAEAVNTIRNQESRDVVLILIAGTFKEDPKYKEQILKEREWIKVLYDISHQEVFNILNASNAFVRATQEESYGLSKVEAILCGTPVLATPTGETRGMHLCDFLDQQQMADQLKMILDGENNPDHLKYSAIYQMEAKQNLQSILSAIRPLP